jgi:hypothetical protein
LNGFIRIVNLVMRDQNTCRARCIDWNLATSSSVVHRRPRKDSRRYEKHKDPDHMESSRHGVICSRSRQDADAQSVQILDRGAFKEKFGALAKNFREPDVWPAAC